MSLTGFGGVVALSEVIERLDVVGALDAGIGPVKLRERGVTGGQVLAALAQCQLFGGHGLVALDRQRADAAAGQLSVLPGVPSTTAAGIAGRFGPPQLAGIEAGLAVILARAVARLGDQRRTELFATEATIDMDSTEVEVDGRRKKGVADNYAGQKAGRPHLATWAQAGVVLAGELLSGTDDVRPRAADLLRRALGARPAQARGAGRRVRLRADAGYFTAPLATAAQAEGGDYAIAAKRNSAARRAYAAIAPEAWAQAKDMPGAQVTAIDYRPGGWPPEAYTIVRRVRVQTADISHDVRSRRRRTIPADQLALALDGQLNHLHAVSFIVTNIPTGGETFDSVVDVEASFRGRVDIEDRIREAKLGAALRHLPCADPAVNTVWMWAAFTALDLSALQQALTGLDSNAARTANGYAATCSTSPPASSTTPDDSNYDYHPNRNHFPTHSRNYERYPQQPDRSISRHPDPESRTSTRPRSGHTPYPPKTNTTHKTNPHSRRSTHSLLADPGLSSGLLLSSRMRCCPMERSKPSRHRWPWIRFRCYSRPQHWRR